MLLKENKRVRGLIKPVFEPLMAPHMTKVDASIEPGLSVLAWTSMNIESYIDEVYERLGEFDDDKCGRSVLSKMIKTVSRSESC